MAASRQVVIVGYGQMGHAMESLLRDRAGLGIWDIAPDRLEPPDAIRAAAAQCDFLLLCIPTIAHAPALDTLTALLPASARMLSIAKGLDDAGRTAAEILALRFAGYRPWGVLGGPMIANEICAGRAAFAELGTNTQRLYQDCAALFTMNRLRLVQSTNPEGVSWCGVLKNIYAPLIGIADELGWGDNTRGHLIMTALAEMQRLITRFTATTIGVYGDAGLADLVTTITSPSSHHYALGRRVARGEAPAPDLEGIHSLTMLQRQQRINIAGFPLYSIASGLVDDPLHVPAKLRHWIGDSG